MISPASSGLERSGRPLPIWAFVVIVVIYLAIIQGLGLVVNNHVDLVDDKLATTDQIITSMWIPLGAAFLFVYAMVTILGWWQPVLRDDRPVQRWVRVVPIAFAVVIVLGTNYPALADHGLGFTIALLVATQFVGWGEEGMFRGLGVVTLRKHPLSEGGRLSSTSPC